MMPDQRQKILERLRRLMSMTSENGASEAEAMAAAAAASKLMSEHNLSFSTVDEIDAENFCSDQRDWFKGSQGRSRSGPVPPIVTCLPYVCDLCSVEHSFSKYTGKLEFFGAPSDTEVAHYLVVIISRAMDSEWTKFRATLRPGMARRTRASFMLGMSYRIAQRLRDMKPAPSRSAGTGTDLVLVKNALVRERFSAAHSKLQNHASGSKVSSPFGAMAGAEAGSRIALNKGINEASGTLAIASSAEAAP